MHAIGIDVSKDKLDICDCGRSLRIANTEEAIRAWANDLSPDAAVGLEPTGRYHRPVVRELFSRGITVYLFDPYRVKRYHDSMKPRAKTDKVDAKVNARYLEREFDALRPCAMLDPMLEQVKDLLELREKLVEQRTALRMSLKAQEFTLESAAELEAAQARAVAEVEARIRAALKGNELYRRLLEMDGVGQVNAAALTWALRTHKFETDDKFVAFIGLDVRVRESGRYVGESKLTKKGSPTLRKLLYCAASTLRRNKAWKGVFDHYQASGRPPTAVNNIVARKLARIAWAIAQNESLRFDRAKALGT
jgi:transposase